MKSLHRIVSAAAVLLTASLNAFSQTPGIDKVHVRTYVESFNYETMTGTVAIESFVEKDIVDPDATVKPLDIVLVLDISSSMDGEVDIPKYIPQSSTGYKYKDFPDNRYYLYNGEYYKVEKYSPSKKNFFLRFTPDGGSSYLYLKGTGDPTTTMPDAVTDDKDVIWTGVLYTQGKKTRLDVMKDGAAHFVDIIYGKSSSTIDNRIAVVPFDGSAHDGGGLIDVYSGAGTLKSYISGLNFGSGTATGKGMMAAQGIIEGLSSTELSDREQYVILFTDGDANNSDEEMNAVNAGYAIKSLGGTVYSIGLTAGMSDWARTIMDYVSSDYPTIQIQYAAGHDWFEYLGDTKTSSDYYLETANGSDLGDIFAMIASNLDSQMLEFGTDSEVQCEISSTLQIDLPSGASDIKAYTANCTGVSGGDFSFGTQTELTGLTINVSSNEITTEGFDYTENWCGQDGSTVHGKELIIKIPFNFIPTSLDDKLSDIYADDKAPAFTKDGNQYALAAPPAAPEFVELIITKSGLLTGESAIFEIERAPLGSETAAVKVNRIVLTGADDTGTAVSHKVYFLNPAATYNVTEHTDWSWTYKPTETPQSNGFIKQSKDMTTVPAGTTATLNFVNTKYDSSKLPSNAEAIKK